MHLAPDKCLQPSPKQVVKGAKQAKKGFPLSISTFSRMLFSMNYFYRPRGKEILPVRLPSCRVGIVYDCHHVGPAPTGGDKSVTKPLCQKEDVEISLHYLCKVMLEKNDNK